ncbi:helix-turn-helix domain-containing protein [Rhodococcus pyridinivorans]|uniref:helix-turn-helix domain-containing protein n=1 Tax=Rhodococcus pyridinivorans TaxID=103816 RepID=UPI0021640232|nr:helix-turn-helix transcriptional regulator [Rhodococcus pyridinivorans]UVT26520.1 helix-turn-helix domain-containing protein [Rhodococcus pyridinivorans]
MTPEQVFGTRVRIERETRGWSQAELAAKLEGEGLKLHPSAIAKIELRNAEKPRAIRLDEAAALSSLFEVPLDELVGRNKTRDQKAAIERVTSTGVKTLRGIADSIGELEESVKALDVNPDSLRRDATLAENGLLDLSPEGQIVLMRSMLIHNALRELHRVVQPVSDQIGTLVRYGYMPAEEVRQEYAKFSKQVLKLESQPDGSET